MSAEHNFNPYPETPPENTPEGFLHDHEAKLSSMNEHPVFKRAEEIQDKLDNRFFNDRSSARAYAESYRTGLDKEALDAGLLGKQAYMTGYDIRLPRHNYATNEDGDDVFYFVDELLINSNELETEPPEIGGEFEGFAMRPTRVKDENDETKGWQLRLCMRLSQGTIPKTAPMARGLICAHGDITRTDIMFAEDRERQQVKEAIDRLVCKSSLEEEVLDALNRPLASDKRYGSLALGFFGRATRGLLGTIDPKDRPLAEEGLADLLKARLGIDGQRQFQVTTSFSLERVWEEDEYGNERLVRKNSSENKRQVNGIITDIVYLPHTEIAAAITTNGSTDNLTPYFAIYNHNNGIHKLTLSPLEKTQECQPVR
jgi:hypothetical protein